MSSPAPHVYVLSGANNLQVGSNTAITLPVLQLQRVSVPDYLDTTDIHLFTGAHELTSSHTGRWGERLSSGIGRALRADLAVRLPQHAVVLSRPAERSGRQILVTVDAFDVRSDGRCVLASGWTIQEAETGMVLVTGRKTLACAPNSSGGSTGDAVIVASMAEVVGQLADSIARTVKALSPESASRANHQQGPPPPSPNSGSEKNLSD